MKKTILTPPMGRSCSLELRLVPARDGAQPPSSPNSVGSRTAEESPGSSQNLTIFYNGRVCVCDMTEIQARAILCLAKREMDQQLAKNSLDPCQLLQPHAPMHSMKKSLQRFLQKRQSRIRETSPYGQ